MNPPDTCARGRNRGCYETGWLHKGPPGTVPRSRRAKIKASATHIDSDLRQTERDRKDREPRIQTINIVQLTRSPAYGDGQAAEAKILLTTSNGSNHSKQYRGRIIDETDSGSGRAVARSLSRSTIRSVWSETAMVRRCCSIEVSRSLVFSYSVCMLSTVSPMMSGLTRLVALFHARTSVIAAQSTADTGRVSR
jgi:hypothetical protein